ncbi:MAG: glutathione peroxidase [Clostridia bacterium]|nr:glutathione peroxidase [Clostridia bacterium]
MNVYDFTVTDNQGNEVSLADYKGKVLLIINSATHCGFTPQYKELEALYTKDKDKGFVILDFPSNQFGEQAPGSDSEIHQFCTLKYNVDFPQFHKIDVNGRDAAPLFTYLKEQEGFAGFDPKNPLTPTLDEILSKADPNYKDSSDIKWNFTKFLIDRDGNVVERFEPTTDMEVVSEEVEKLL